MQKARSDEAMVTTGTTGHGLRLTPEYFLSSALIYATDYQFDYYLTIIVNIIHCSYNTL